MTVVDSNRTMNAGAETDSAVLDGTGLKIVLPGLAMIAVAYGLARFSYGLFLPEIRQEFRLESALLGVIGGGSYLGYCISVTVSGVLCMRWGPRAVVTLAGSAAIGGMCLIAAAPSGVMLALGVLIAGTSAGLASPPMGDVVQSRIAKPHQGAANTWINSGTSLGILVSGLVAFVAGDGWRMAWLSFAVVALGVTVWCFPVLPKSSVAAELSRSRRRNRNAAGQGATRWLTRRSLPLLGSAFAMGMVSSVYWTFSRDLIVSSGRVSDHVSLVFWVVIGVAGFIGGLAGSLVRNRGLTFALCGCLISFGASIALLTLAPGMHILVFTSGIAFGASYILLTGIYLIWSVTVFPQQPSLGIALSFAMIAIGQAVGSPLAGQLATVIGWSAVFWSFGLLSCAAALITPHRTRRKPEGTTNPFLPSGK